MNKSQVIAVGIYAVVTVLVGGSIAYSQIQNTKNYKAYLDSLKK